MKIPLLIISLALLSTYTFGQVNDERATEKQLELMQRHIEALEEQNQLLKGKLESFSKSYNHSQPGISKRSSADRTEIRSKAHFYSEFYVPSDSNLRDIQQSILEAGLRQQWEVVDSSANLVVLHLKRKDHDSTLYFEYDNEKISLYSDSYQIIRQSGWRKVQDPDGWIFTLQELIGERFE